MSEYKQKINVLVPDKVRPFEVIVKSVGNVEGGTIEVAKALGVSRTVVRGILEREFLTDKQARNILVGYRQWKIKRNHEVGAAEAKQ